MAFDRREYKKLWDSKRAQKHSALIQRWKVFKGCAVCGYKKHFASLCLDHLDPAQKDRNARNNRAINMSWGKDRIKAELAKCQVLCANCHQERTWKEGHYKFGPEIGSTRV
jgi:hypothetical protein